MKFVINGILIITSIGILSICILLGIIYSTEQTFYFKASPLEVNKETELQLKINNKPNSPINVLNEKGELNLVGWTSNDKNLIFNSSLINPSNTYNVFKDYLNKYRYKKWDAYCFSNKNYVGTVAFFDLEYLGGVMFHISKIDYSNTEKMSRMDNEENSIIRYPIVFEFLHPSLKPSINDQCKENTLNKNILNQDSLCFNGITEDDLLNYFNNHNTSVHNTGFDLKKLNITISPITKKHVINFELSNKILDFNIKFDNVELQSNNLDSIVTLTPMIEDKTLFYYNVKTYNMEVSDYNKYNKYSKENNSKKFEEKEIKQDGGIIINDKKEDNMLFTYDAGRGAWPLKSGWIWICGNGRLTDGSVFGFNSGHGFTHSSAKFTEDAFFINGKMHKLYNLQYVVSEQLNEYGYKDFLFGVFAEDNGKKFNNFIRNKKNERFNKNSISENTKNTDDSFDLIGKFPVCNLIFHVSNIKNSKINVIIADVVFDVYYGYYSGSCYDENGKEYVVEYANGQIENKISLW